MLSPQRVSPDEAGVAPGALSRALLASVFVIAACGLVYELVAGAAASYLLGDSVTQFSIVIGTYLAAMGVGSYLSRYILSGLVARFFEIELAIALLGGVSATAMFIAFAHLGETFRFVLFGFVFLIGVLVGLEIPLVMRILRDRLGFRELVATVLSFDYLGALAVSLAFPLVLAPRLGLIRTAFLFGLMNALVAAWALYLFRAQLQPFAWRAAQVAFVVALLGAGLAGADRLTTFAEEELYADRILHAQSTRYQRIVVTKWRNDVRLFLNGNLQFSSADEYRYHEALVHPALATLPAARRVLVLGGGDGLAVREILRYPQIESVTLVDLDPEMTRLFAPAPTGAARASGRRRWCRACRASSCSGRGSRRPRGRSARSTARAT
jgi:spermidine synthase